MNIQEYYYRRTIGAIGFSLLVWLCLFEAFSLFLTLILPLILQGLLASAPIAANVVYQAIYAIGYLFCFMIPVLFLKRFLRKAGYSFQPMYAPLRVSPWLPLIVLSGITLIFSAAYFNSFLMDLIGYSTEAIILENPTASADPQAYELVLDFMVVCLVPGFCEEFLFRGAILSNCLPFGKGKAIIISSLLFSLMHRNAEQIFYAFVAGILLGIIYVRTKSIWNCVILHTINNFISNTEGTILKGIKETVLAATYIHLLELLIFTLGILSTVILIIKFFSQKDSRIHEGIFGKQLSPCDEYAQYPISSKRAGRLFLAPSMVIFLILCVLQILALILIVVVGGKIFGMLG